MTSEETVRRVADLVEEGLRVGKIPWTPYEDVRSAVRDHLAARGIAIEETSVETLARRSAERCAMLPAFSGMHCPKCRQGLENKFSRKCGENGYVQRERGGCTIEGEHLHRTCPCGYKVIEKPADAGALYAVTFLPEGWQAPPVVKVGLSAEDALATYYEQVSAGAGPRLFREIKPTEIS